MSEILIVSGTGTDVGKTIVTAAIAANVIRAGKSVSVVKPGQTGVTGDEPGDLAVIAANHHSRQQLQPASADNRRYFLPTLLLPSKD